MSPPILLSRIRCAVERAKITPQSFSGLFLKNNFFLPYFELVVRRSLHTLIQDPDFYVDLRETGIPMSEPDTKIEIFIDCNRTANDSNSTVTVVPVTAYREIFIVSVS